MAIEGYRDIAALGYDAEALLARVLDQSLNQLRGDTAPADRGRNQRVIGHPHAVAQYPGETAHMAATLHVGAVFAAIARIVPGDGNLVHTAPRCLTLASRRPIHPRAMQFLSDNAAAVHPRVWQAMRNADAPQPPYDNDALSHGLDAAFSELFARPCAVLWAATGTAANCLALATLVPPHGGVICHREAHIETDECGAPGFYTHGAKLILAEGEGALLTPAAVTAAIGAIRKDVHQVQPHALSLSQASEYGRVYRPGEMAELGEVAREHGLKLHVDGARFANAVAFLECTPWEACQGADTLAFGCIKNGGMSAEALVLFDPELADLARLRRKRAGHLQSKGRFLAAQLLALVEDGLWLDNARAANAAARELAKATAGRLLHPVEANEVFLALSADERAALRARGFAFYDWGEDAARLVTAWNADPGHVHSLAEAIGKL